MRLDVPFVAQTNSQLCGAAVADMILRYYGIKPDPTLMSDLLAGHNCGTDMAKIGRIFLRSGFTTEFVSSNPALCDAKKSEHTQEMMRKNFEQLARFDNAGTQDIVKLQSLLDYMNEGGLVRLQTPTVAMVHAELDRGRPAIGCLTTNFTRTGRPLRNAHYIVIEGYRRRKTIILDPIVERTYSEETFLGSFGGDKKVKSSSLFSGLYSDDNHAFDEGSILLIRKKPSL